MAVAILGSFEHKEYWELGRSKEMDAEKNLTSYLRYYFQEKDDNLASLQIHCRETDALGGRLLHPVFVGRLEVDRALASLRARDWLAGGAAIKAPGGVETVGELDLVEEE